MLAAGIDAIEALGVGAGEVVGFELGGIKVGDEAAAGEREIQATVGGGDGYVDRLNGSSIGPARVDGDGGGWEGRAVGFAMASKDERLSQGG